MKKSIRLISIFTAALLLASTFALWGCAQEETATTPDGTTAAIEGADVEATTEAGGGDVDKDQAIIDAYELEAIDFEGHNFRILASGETDEWKARDVYVAEETGDVLSDAVYRRRIAIEEKYNIKITEVPVTRGNYYSSINKIVNAGTDEYDALFINLVTASKSAKAGHLLNLNDIKYIDLTQPWWDQSLMSDTTVMNKVYFATGDISIMDNDGTWTMMFNKKMIADFALDNPYELVTSGKWTVDKLQEMMKGVTKDLNGDGTIDHTDQVGWATTGNTVKGLFYSFGMRIIRKDENDMPYYDLPQDPSAIEKLNRMFDVLRPTDGSTMYDSDYSKVNPLTHQIVQAAFEEDRALFYAEVMQCVERIRKMETPFGIIPLPKWNENQEKYQTYVHEDASTVLAIPVTATDRDRTGIIVESLAHEGRRYITPAYKEIALKGKYARDNESSAMIDLIFEGRSADIGMIDLIGTIQNDLAARFSSRKTDFASWLDGKSSKVDTALTKLIEAYEVLE